MNQLLMAALLNTSDGGSVQFAPATLSFWAPLTDAGAGIVNTTPTLGTGPATFTRATSATTFLSNGLLVTIPSGSPRSLYVGALYAGYFSEEARTNEAFFNRDFTNAAWVKTTMSAALTQTGIDGAGNTCSLLTASAGNATALQAITSASAVARRWSVYMKRSVGTGNIDITMDNGAAWTTVSGSINSSTFTRVGKSQTLANPTVGIRIVTNGDAVIVDYVQEEIGAFDTSPILTAGVVVTRNADVLTYPLAGNINNVTGSCYSECLVNTAIGVGTKSVIMGSGTEGGMFVNASAALFDGTNVAAAVGSLSLNAVHKIAGSWGVGPGLTVAQDGGAPVNTAFDGSMNLTGIAFGANTAGGGQFNGGVMNVKISTLTLTGANLIAATR